MAHRVLLVDDSAATRAFAAAALEEVGGWEVEVAGGGAEALALLQRGAFDVVVTDVNMPDINGLELIRFVRGHERHAALPVLVISTEGRDRDVDRAMALGATDYLAKPFSPEQLVAAVRALLGDRAGE